MPCSAALGTQMLNPTLMPSASAEGKHTWAPKKGLGHTTVPCCLQKQQVRSW